MAMREIKRHWVDGGAMTDELKLSAVDNPGPGGANHHYYVEIMLPGAALGAVVGFATQRFGGSPAASLAGRSASRSS